MKRVVFLIVIALFATECFGGRFFGHKRCRPCYDPCLDSSFNCFDPCFDPTYFQETSKLEGKTSPLMEGRTSPIEVLKEEVIKSKINEGDTSPLPKEELPPRFFDGTEEIKPEPTKEMPLPVPFDDTWKKIGETPKLKIHYKYKVEEIEYLIVRTPEGRFYNLPVINGVLPSATIGKEHIDVHYRGNKMTNKFREAYKKVGYCQYYKPINNVGWHVYTLQQMRNWTHLNKKGMLHSARRTGQNDADVRILTFDGQLVKVDWNKLSHADQVYVSEMYKPKFAKR